MNYFEGSIASICQSAGLKIDGSNTYDPQVLDHKRFYESLANKGMLGLGEAFMAGYWDCADLSTFFFKALREGLLERLAHSLPMRFLRLRYLLSNPQAEKKATLNATEHYGKRNVAIQNMLDSRLTYTCALWKDPLPPCSNNDESLEDAQVRKLELICQKLHLKPGMTLLDIGCGWGSLAGYAAERYHVKVTGVTPVPEQAEYVRERYKHLPVQVFQTEYQNIEGRYDRVVSVGMVEHVGLRNLPLYMKTVDHCMKSDGLHLLHCFGRSNTTIPLIDPWTERYIFPGLYFVTASQLISAAEKHFDVLDVQEIGQHYYKTLMRWNSKFTESWPNISAMFKDESMFYRMWTYYLLSGAGAFLARTALLWQFVFCKRGDKSLYQPVRLLQNTSFSKSGMNQ